MGRGGRAAYFLQDHIVNPINITIAGQTGKPEAQTRIRCCPREPAAGELSRDSLPLLRQVELLSIQSIVRIRARVPVDVNSQVMTGTGVSSKAEPVPCIGFQQEAPLKELHIAANFVECDLCRLFTLIGGADRREVPLSACVK